MDKKAPLRKTIQQKSLNFPNTPRRCVIVCIQKHWELTGCASHQSNVARIKTNLKLSLIQPRAQDKHTQREEEKSNMLQDINSNFCLPIKSVFRI